MGRHCDIAIVGGGLSGGLIAAAIARHRPEITLRLIDAGQRLGGNHRWSWFDSDLTPAARELLAPFRKHEWDEGCDVGFPAHVRRLSTPYRSLASRDFDAALRRALPWASIRLEAVVERIDAGGVTLAGGERISARAVIDCRGQAPSAQLSGGWRVFLGRHLRTERPHRVARPVIMDATMPQPGACRFVYVLPLGSHDLFVEDTYYAESPALDRGELARRIDGYCAQHGWAGEIVGWESGALPVIAGGDFAAFQAEHRTPGVARAGARAGLTHPLTSYSLPIAAEVALAVARDADLPAEQLAAVLEARAATHWARTRFYRRLAAMLFAAAPEQRYRLFERFYTLPQGLIERFYAGRSTTLDRARILCGKPPLPLARALSAIRPRRASTRANPAPAEAIAASSPRGRQPR